MTAHDEDGTLELRLPEVYPLLPITYPVALPEMVMDLDVTRVLLNAFLPRGRHRFPVEISVAMPAGATEVLLTLSAESTPHRRERMTREEYSREACLLGLLRHEYFPTLLNYVHFKFTSLGLAHYDYPFSSRGHPAALAREHCGPGIERATPHLTEPGTCRFTSPWTLIPPKDLTDANLGARATWTRYETTENLGAATPKLCEVVQGFQSPRATITFRRSATHNSGAGDSTDTTTGTLP